MSFDKTPQSVVYHFKEYLKDSNNASDAFYEPHFGNFSFNDLLNFNESGLEPDFGHEPDFSLDEIDDLEQLLDDVRGTIDNVGAISSPSLFWTLCLVYLLFIVVGFFGNVLILWAVLGRESMRTARNVFIVTLALSDLVLCCFTMPSTLWEVLYRRWPFGESTVWLCKLVNAGQATPVFMSSLSIVAIALDRYRCIIQPDLTQLSVKHSVICSALMAAFSTMMSVPLFAAAELSDHFVAKQDEFLDALKFEVYACIDNRKGALRRVYNLSSMFLQFILPLLIVLVVYVSIINRLRNRPQSQHSENNR